MACLNEAQTIGECVEKALCALKALGLQGEVLVVDNGSTDGSATIAASKGARVVHETRRGYGCAYRRGFKEAKGRIVVMGDADGTYDFSDLKNMISPLENGADFVIGSRLNGHMLPGSMSWIKLRLGNQISTRLINFVFKMKLSDSQSGFRALHRNTVQDFPLKSTGMELATEMIIAALHQRLRISEIPITYYPRKGTHSKFKIFRDSFSILRLIFSSFLRPPRGIPPR